MDRQEAVEALTSVDTLGRQMRHRARWTSVHVAVLGLLTIVMVLVIGLYGDNATLRTAAFLAVVFALIGMNWYAYGRPVALRGHLAAHYVLTGVGVALFTCTVVIGRAVFPGALQWWVADAVLSGLPFFLAVFLNLVSTRRA